MISWKEMLIKCDLTHPFTRLFFHLYHSSGTLFSQTRFDYCNDSKNYVLVCSLLQSWRSLCVNPSLWECGSFRTDLLSACFRLRHPLWGTQECAVGWSCTEQRLVTHPRDGLNSLSLCSSRLWFLSVAALWLPADSVDRVAHLVQLQQEVVRNVKCGEAN